jgi:hypothetical protein
MKKPKSAQEIQDEIFRRMSAGRKIKLTSDFFRFLTKLNPNYLKDGARGLIEKIRMDSQKA